MTSAIANTSQKMQPICRARLVAVFLRPRAGLHLGIHQIVALEGQPVGQTLPWYNRSIVAAKTLERIESEWNRLSVIRIGKTVELRSTLGVFSVYRPDRVLTGFAWDSLSLAPSLLSSPPRRILLLGMGGGTVVHQCRAFYHEARIDAVEIDATVIRLARKYFHLPRAQVRAVRADALQFVREASGPYDAILDDVWPEQGSAAKPLFAAPDYLAGVCRLLARDGVYAANLWGVGGRASEIPRAGRMLRPLFRRMVLLVPPEGPTRALAAMKGREAPPPEARRRLRGMGLRVKML
ncbi:MAG: hypothetical protein HY236_08870 [Acidobacteria bacterium]|nr:hypothetical protein [Acidobacteriota bacterium]